jgi:hypothetical protein
MGSSPPCNLRATLDAAMTTRSTPGASLIANYGPKDAHFAAWLSWLQDQIGAQPASSFQPRHLYEIHGTIIALDNPIRTVGVSDILGLRDVMESSLSQPIRLQFGGYSDSLDHFTSRGATPYQRSYSISEGLHVVIGWPAANEGLPLNALGILRRELERFGVRHRYHWNSRSDDFDAYMVVGADLSEGKTAIGAHEHGVRRLFADHPVVIDLDVSRIGIALYEKATLEYQSTEYFPLATINTATAELIVDYLSLISDAS